MLLDNKLSINNMKEKLTRSLDLKSHFVLKFEPLISMRALFVLNYFLKTHHESQNHIVFNHIYFNDKSF